MANKTLALGISSVLAVSLLASCCCRDYNGATEASATSAETTTGTTTTISTATTVTTEAVTETTTSVSTTVQTSKLNDSAFDVSESSSIETVSRQERAEPKKGEIADLVVQGIQSMEAQDYESIMAYTNFGDVCRMLNGIADDKQNQSLSDEEILQKIKSGNNDFTDALEIWNETAEILKLINKDSLSKPEQLSQAELHNIFHVLEDLFANGVPNYKGCYRLKCKIQNRETYLYVFQDENDVWRFDICFGTMYEKLNTLIN